MSYARNTKVPVDRSKAEVERILTNYGADQFSSGWNGEKAVIQFRLHGRYIRIEMPLAAGARMTVLQVVQENRRRWRAMVLFVKAKLEGVESGIVTFEQAFMANIILPNRQTVGEFMQPQIESAYAGGKMPKLLEDCR